MIECKIEIAPTSDILEVRTKILRPGQWPTPEKYAQDNLQETIHVVAKNDDEVIAIATFFPNLPSADLLPGHENTRCFQLRGMGVIDDYRRKGVGAKVVKFAVRHLAINQPQTLLWFNARQTAIPFYESLGFHCVGDFFQVPKIGPHKVMWKVLDTL